MNITTMDIKKEHKKLCKEINTHNNNYYNLNNPTITDKEYDLLFDKLIKLEQQYPELITSNSPTQKVGSSASSNLKKVKHNTPLLSLEKAQTEEELRNFLNKFKNSTFIVQPKLDGLTIKDVFSYGYRQVSATRGNGEEGEDITHSVNNINNVPKNISFDGYLEVRGEAVIPINKFLQIQGEYKTSRNLVAGTVRTLDSNLTKERGVEVLYYDLSDLITDQWKGDTFEDDIETLEFLKRQGFPIVDYEIFTNIEDVVNYCLNYDRSKLNYEIDGLVIKVADYKTRRKVGSTSHHPKWAIAYKFAAQEKETTLKHVEWQVGRTGVLTPVLLFDAVDIGGVLITKCTGHNLDFINNFKINDKIIIKRSNDVIPYAIPQPEKRNGIETDIDIPKYCPSCNASTEIKSPFLYCTNDNCNSKTIEKIIHFAKRDCMDIEGLGDSVAEELVNRKLVKNISDIYNLTKKDLLNIPLFALKKANNLLRSIENSKEKPLNCLIYALGIPNVGKTTAKVLATKYKTIDNLRKVNINSLLTINDIGDITSDSIVNYFKDEDNNIILDNLINSGLNVEVVEDKINNILQEKSFVITGTLSKSRDEFVKLIEQNGGKISTSISKKTDYLLAGEKAGSKLKKANECGATILNEEDFYKLIK